MKCRHGRGIDFAAKQLARELARLRLAESGEAQPAHDPHAFHVGDERGRLAHEGRFLRADGEREEQRARPARAHEVTKHAQRVFISPLRVVDEDGDRCDPRQRLEAKDSEIVRAHQPLVAGLRLEAGLDLARDRVQGTLDRLGLRPADRRVARGGSGEDGLPDEQWGMQLFVGRDGDGQEAVGGRELGEGSEQSGLADARLSLEGHDTEAALARRREFLAQRRDLDRPPDERSGRAAGVECQRGGLSGGQEGRGGGGFGHRSMLSAPRRHAPRGPRNSSTRRGAGPCLGLLIDAERQGGTDQPGDRPGGEHGERARGWHA